MDSNKSDKYIIAIELSSSQAKGAVASVAQTPYAKMEVPTVEIVAHDDNSEFVRYGRIQNMVDAEVHSSFVLSKLKNHPSMTGRDIAGLYVGLGGLSLISVRTKANLDLPTPMIINDEVMRKLEMEANKQVPGDKEILAVLPRKFLVDKKICAKPNGAMGSSIYGEYTVVMAAPANRDNLRRVLEERMGMRVIRFVITPLAVADAVLSEEEKQLGCLLIDFGHQTTTVSIYKDRALQRIATIPLGGYHITTDIATGLKLTFDKAEERKQSVGTAINQPSASIPDDVRQLNSYLQARLGEIMANVMHQLSSIGLKAADLASGAVVTGRGAKLQALGQYVKEMTKLETRLAPAPAAVLVKDSDIVASDYTSLLSIVAAAASEPDFAGSTSSTEPAEVNEEQQTLGQPAAASDAGGLFFPATAQPYADPHTAAVPTSKDYVNDDNVLLDDEVVEARIAEEEKKRQQKESQPEAGGKKLSFFGIVTKKLGDLMQRNADDGKGNDNQSQDIGLDEEIAQN